MVLVFAVCLCHEDPNFSDVAFYIEKQVLSYEFIWLFRVFYFQVFMQIFFAERSCVVMNINMYQPLRTLCGQIFLVLDCTSILLCLKYVSVSFLTYL